MTIEDQTFSFPDKETFICDECGDMHYVSEGSTVTSEGVICADCHPPLYQPEEEVEEEVLKKEETAKEESGEETLGYE